MIQEIEKKCYSGYPIIAALVVAQVVTVLALISSAIDENPLLIVLFGILAALVFLLWFGLFMVHPNKAKVLQLFGSYAGTARVAGLRWANPFFSKKAVSVRIRNFESAKMKVNDKLGNPVEIAAVVVWRVVDTAEAVFEVDDYVNFVHIQSEAALRNLATCYPYDQHEADEISLRSHTLEIAARIRDEIQERLAKAGVEVLESRISHLAYAPEIASAMLQRQQATAIIAARQKIVEGAVGMVQMALSQLAREGVVDLDEERKAAMVSNLLVVLCGNHDAQPIVNTGSLYQ